MTEIQSAPASCVAPARSGWLRRLGVWGFAFFAIKGMLWLIVPALAARGAFNYVKGGSTPGGGAAPVQVEAAE